MENNTTVTRLPPFTVKCKLCSIARIYTCTCVVCQSWFHTVCSLLAYVSRSACQWKKQKGVIIIHMNPQKWRCNQNNVPFIRAEWLLSCDLNCCSALSWSVLNNMIQINYCYQSWTCLLKHFCDFIAIMHVVIIMSGQPVYAFLEGDALWQCHIIRLEHCKMKHIDIKQEWVSTVTDKGQCDYGGLGASEMLMQWLYVCVWPINR